MNQPLTSNGAVSYDSKHWGFDFLGYGQTLVNDYRKALGSKLPCGTTLYQDMYWRCNTTLGWTMYTENYLTATIKSASTYNCHEDSEGDYTACETEDH